MTTSAIESRTGRHGRSITRSYSWARSCPNSSPRANSNRSRANLTDGASSAFNSPVMITTRTTTNTSNEVSKDWQQRRSGNHRIGEIDKQFPLSSSMMPRQSNPQYPPTQLKAGVSSRASQEHPSLDYHAMPNRFPPFPGVYGPPPPFYAAAHNQMSCYPHYPLRYRMHYG